MKSKEELDPQKVEFLNKIADFIVKKGLDVVAVLYIESMRPLHRLSSNLVTFFEPFVSVAVSGNKIAMLRECLEDERYIDYLLERIENPPKK
ncbi:MAG: hypothetical protein KAQ98_11725 [Bacteriovoracaceae bacterium]|nr:hypothetical protein [Bacteriovoracaceae bacterium]